MATNCATTLLFSDDFSSYGTSDAAVSTAYTPGLFGGDGYDDPATDVGPTLGPDGQPGIRDQVSGAVRDTGALDKCYFTPLGPCFRVKGRWNFAAYNRIGASHPFIQILWAEPPVGNDSTSNFVTLTRVHSTQTLRVTVQTISPHGNAVGNTIWSQDFTGALPTNVPKTVEVFGKLSTVNAGIPDVDGFVVILIDDVVTFTFENKPVWGDRSDLEPTTPRWNIVRIATIGAFSNFLIYSGDLTSTVGVDAADVCGCSGIEPGDVANAGGQGAGATPVLTPIIGQQLVCAGGGTVPTQADLTHSEVWWSN